MGTIFKKLAKNQGNNCLLYSHFKLVCRLLIIVTTAVLAAPDSREQRQSTILIGVCAKNQHFAMDSQHGRAGFHDARAQLHLWQ